MNKDRIQISLLNRLGRLGNQLFIYLFSKRYAELHNCILETPPWIGQKLFENINDPPISSQLPKTKEDQWEMGMTNIDLFGYYQNSKSLGIMTRQWVKDTLKFKQCYIDAFPKIKPHYAAAHLRRGDYVSQHQDLYVIIPEESYQECCVKNNINYNELVWVSEENPSPNPFPDAELNFLADFFILMQSDILLRANSSFSFWAGVLSNAKIYSPVIDGKRGRTHVEFVEGNHAKLVEPKFSNSLSTDLHLPE